MIDTRFPILRAAGNPGRSRIAMQILADTCYDPEAMDELIRDEDDIRVALCGTRYHMDEEGF